MEKDGASQALYAGAEVVARHYNNVVKIIVAAKIFMRRSVGERDPTIVVSIANMLAPAPLRSQRADWQSSCRARDAVGAIEDFDKLIAADRACAIALPLHAPAAAAAERTWKN